MWQDPPWGRLSFQMLAVYCWAALCKTSMLGVESLVSKYAVGKTSHAGRTNQRLKNKRVANMNPSLMNQGVANKFTWGGMFPNLWLQHPCSSNFGSCLQRACWECPCHALSEAFRFQGSLSQSGLCINISMTQEFCEHEAVS